MGKVNLKALSVVLLGFGLMIGFQNCSGVSFDSVDDHLTVHDLSIGPTVNTGEIPGNEDPTQARQSSGPGADGGTVDSIPGGELPPADAGSTGGATDGTGGGTSQTGNDSPSSSNGKKPSDDSVGNQADNEEQGDLENQESADNNSSDDNSSDDKDHADNSKSNAKFICIVDGPGKSLKIGVDRVHLGLESQGSTPYTVCMSARACVEIVSQVFSIKGDHSGPKQAGFCPDKNPHVITLSDEEVQAKIDSMK